MILDKFCNYHEQNCWIVLRTAASFTLFFRFGSLRLLSLCKYEEMALCKKMSNKEIISETNAYIAEFERLYVLEGLKSWKTVGQSISDKRGICQKIRILVRRWFIKQPL